MPATATTKPVADDLGTCAMCAQTLGESEAARLSPACVIASRPALGSYEASPASEYIQLCQECASQGPEDEWLGYTPHRGAAPEHSPWAASLAWRGLNRWGEDPAGYDPDPVEGEQRPCPGIPEHDEECPGRGRNLVTSADIDTTEGRCDRCRARLVLLDAAEADAEVAR